MEVSLPFGHPHPEQDWPVSFTPPAGWGFPGAFNWARSKPKISCCFFNIFRIQICPGSWSWALGQRAQDHSSTPLLHRRSVRVQCISVPKCQH